MRREVCKVRQGPLAGISRHVIASIRPCAKAIVNGHMGILTTDKFSGYSEFPRRQTSYFVRTLFRVLDAIPRLEKIAKSSKRAPASDDGKTSKRSARLDGTLGFVKYQLYDIDKVQSAATSRREVRGQGEGGREYRQRNRERKMPAGTMRAHRDRCVERSIIRAMHVGRFIPHCPASLCNTLHARTAHGGGIWAHSAENRYSA